MKEYTIIRRRTVVQIQTDQVQAETETEALEIANKDQCVLENSMKQMQMNGRIDLDDVIEYPVLTSDDILEVTEVERA